MNRPIVNRYKLLLDLHQTVAVLPLDRVLQSFTDNFYSVQQLFLSYSLCLVRHMPTPNQCHNTLNPGSVFGNSGLKSQTRDLRGQDIRDP